MVDKIAKTDDGFYDADHKADRVARADAAAEAARQGILDETPTIHDYLYGMGFEPVGTARNVVSNTDTDAVIYARPSMVLPPEPEAPKLTDDEEAEAVELHRVKSAREMFHPTSTDPIHAVAVPDPDPSHEDCVVVEDNSSWYFSRNGKTIAGGCDADDLKAFINHNFPVDSPSEVHRHETVKKARAAKKAKLQVAKAPKLEPMKMEKVTSDKTDPIKPVVVDPLKPKSDAGGHW